MSYTGAQGVTGTSVYGVEVSTDQTFVSAPLTVVQPGTAWSTLPPAPASVTLSLPTGTYYVGADANITGAGQAFPIPKNNPVVGAPSGMYNGVVNNNYNGAVNYAWTDAGGNLATAVIVPSGGASVAVTLSDTYSDVGFSGKPQASLTSGGALLTLSGSDAVTISGTSYYFWAQVFMNDPQVYGTGPSNQTPANDWGSFTTGNMNVSCLKDLNSSSSVYVLLYLDPNPATGLSNEPFQAIQAGDPYVVIGPTAPQTADVTSNKAGALLSHGVTVVASNIWGASTATPTNTPTDTATDTITDTITNTPAITSTPTGTPTQTATSTITATLTNSPTVTVTSTPLPNLTPGSIAFTGFVQNGSSEFSFVAPNGLPASQVVYFTNEGYNATSGALFSNNVTVGADSVTIVESVVSYTASATGLGSYVPVVISKVANDPNLLQGGTASGNLTLNHNGLGHKILAFTVSAGVTQYVAGLIFGPDSWLPNGTVPVTFYDSNLPTGLDSTTTTDLSSAWNSNSLESLAAQGNDNAVLNTCESSLSAVVNPADWVVDGNIPTYSASKPTASLGLDSGPLVVCANGSAGWTGTVPPTNYNYTSTPTSTPTDTPTDTATATPTATP